MILSDAAIRNRTTVGVLCVLILAAGAFLDAYAKDEGEAHGRL